MGAPGKCGNGWDNVPAAEGAGGVSEPAIHCCKEETKIKPRIKHELVYTDDIQTVNSFN